MQRNGCGMTRNSVIEWKFATDRKWNMPVNGCPNTYPPAEVNEDVHRDPFGK